MDWTSCVTDNLSLKSRLNTSLCLCLRLSPLGWQICKDVLSTHSRISYFEATCNLFHFAWEITYWTNNKDEKAHLNIGIRCGLLIVCSLHPYAGCGNADPWVVRVVRAQSVHTVGPTRHRLFGGGKTTHFEQAADAGETQHHAPHP